ncbi:SCA7, zinc-binding domain-containing protein [Mucidula mucida]|nr:SCA7, zinc-binding domain-containing protein [Mucidula mucida]
MVKKASNAKASPSPPPFNWDASLPSSPAPDPSSSLPAPTAWLEASGMKIYGAQPISSTSDIGVVRCKDCAKPILRSCLLDHLTTCAEIRKRSQAAEVQKSAKKRKASLEPTDSSQPSKKKSKTVAKPRVKGPIDYDKQCGVINDKGVPCSRSLTCKSHAMGAKRAVQGRSRDYNELLLEYQRANNPNFVEPVKRESKAEKKEKREKEKQEKKRLAEEASAAMGPKKSNPEKSKKGKKAAAAAAAAANKLAENKTGEVEENIDDLDSEAEVDNLVVSYKVAREKGLVAQPLAIPCDTSSWFVARRERARCVRDLLSGALGGIGGTAVIGGLGMGRTGLAVRP